MPSPEITEKGVMPPASGFMFMALNVKTATAARTLKTTMNSSIPQPARNPLLPIKMLLGFFSPCVTISSVTMCP